MSQRRHGWGRTWTLSAIACVVLLTDGCDGSPPLPRRITEADQSQTVELRVGERIELILSGNPTTGYTWELGDIDTTVLRQIGEIAYQQTGQGVGAGGAFTIRFEAVAAGRTVLRMRYVRPWERQKPPERAFEATVVVR